jgi:hypothetical protein
MTELAYMIHEDWAQGGTSMVAQSGTVRDWLGEPPYVFDAPDPKRLHGPNSADGEFVDHVASERSSRHLVSFSELRKVAQQDKRFDGTLTVLYPHE